MREIRLSGSEGGVALIPPSLPLSGLRLRPGESVGMKPKRIWRTTFLRFRRTAFGAGGAVCGAGRSAGLQPAYGEITPSDDSVAKAPLHAPA
jgi:hypothetical protein